MVDVKHGEAGAPSRVRIDRDEDGIAVLAMADLEGKNAMSEPFLEALVSAFAELARDREIKVIVLTGLPEIFSSGASADLLLRLTRGDAEPTDIVLPKLVLDLPIPVVAAMEGHAIGGGFALGACADIVVIARESRYGLSFMNMGFTPGMGTTQLLSHVLSPAIVAELLLGGEPKKGSWYEGRSGFNAILPRADVVPHAMSIARRIAEKPRLALEMLRRTLTLERRRAFEQTYTIETLMHRVSFSQADLLARIEEHHAE